MKILELENIEKRFGDTKAVIDLSISVESGHFVVIVGPSGCGKTTLLRLISGFERPDHGEIRYRGREITQLPPEKRDIGIVFQDFALFPHMNVRQNISYGLRHDRAKSQDEKTNLLLEISELMSVESLLDRMPEQLSSGQQQRVALARSLAPKPDLLLLDEPFSALDVALRDELRWELKELQRSLKITTIHVTHDQEEALALADQLVIMNSGLLEQMGSPQEIYKTPGSRFVAEFVGRGNLISCFVRNASQDYAEIAMGADAILRIPQKPEGLLASDQNLELLIRPEHFQIDLENRSDLWGRLLQHEYYGHSYLVKVGLGNSVCNALFDPESFEQWLRSEQESLHLTIDPENIQILS